jgi:hypothetical protein
MFDVLGQLNWIAVLVGWLAFTLLGGVWFTLVVPKAYNISLGRPKDAEPSKAPIFFIGPAACVLVITIATAILMHALNIVTYGDALLFALIAGIGYLVANTTNIAINPNFPRPLLYALLSGVWNLAGIAIVSVLIVAIR